MVIYDLTCDSGHQFEGWFKDAEDLVSQQASGILCCPICDSSQVNKKLTAPKLCKKSNATSKVPAAPQNAMVTSGSSSPKDYAKLQKMLGEVHTFIESNFEDVGNRFTEEAISIHKGEKDATNIRGTASAEQIKELAEEGVSALPLPPKPVDKGKLN